MTHDAEIHIIYDIKIYIYIFIYPLRSDASLASLRHYLDHHHTPHYNTTMLVHIYPSLNRIEPFGITGTITQHHPDYDNLVFVECENYRGWYDTNDLTTSFNQAEYDSRLAKRKAFMRNKKPIKRMGTITESLDQQCEEVWGRNFTKSWQTRKSMDFHKIKSL